MKTLLALFQTLTLITILVSCGAETSLKSPRGGALTSLNNKNGNSAVNPDLCNCIYQYQPVCGQNGLQYDNACIAQCEGVPHSNAPCTQTNPVCSNVVNYVCGSRNGEPASPYLNMCLLHQDGASMLFTGLCP